jgi:methionyl-tRNA synthetase
VHGWLLLGGREAQQDRARPGQAHEIAPARLVEDFGVDGYRYHFLRDVPFGPDGEFSYEGMVARHNADLANNLGNLLSRVATVVERKCGGSVRAPADSPLAGLGRRRLRHRRRRLGPIQPSEALAATWSLIREANSHLEQHEPWKAGPGPEVDAVSAPRLEVLRLVASWRRRPCPRPARRCGPASACPGRTDDSRSRARRRGAATPAAPVTKGAPLFPRLTVAPA